MNLLYAEIPGAGLQYGAFDSVGDGLVVQTLGDSKEIFL